MSTTPAGVRPRSIGHVGLIAHDLERSVGFYESVLGMQVSDRMQFPPGHRFRDGVWLRCNAEHHVISIFDLRQPETPGPSVARAGQAGVHHIAFEMSSVEDLRRLARHAQANDIEIEGMRTGGPGVQLRLYIWDPDDNIVELFWAMDKVGWDGRTRPFPPVTPIELESFDVDAWLAMKGSEFTTEPMAGALAR